MPSLTVTDTRGATRTIDARVGVSLMENMRAADFEDLLALCGGCASCGTCHVFVDDQDLARLPPVGEDEDDLLDMAPIRHANSRLSCQIVFSVALDGMALTIAPAV